LGEPAAKRRRKGESSGSSDSDGPDIKITNIPTLDIQSPYRKRDEWIRDLQRAFDGAPRKFKRDRTKIIFAVDYLAAECRERWYQHIDSLGTAGKKKAEESWAIFEEWSTTLTKDAENRELTVAEELERAKQRSDQSPIAFDTYLSQVENQQPPRTDKERAQLYFVKLLPELRNTLKTHHLVIPQSRSELVNLAMRHWVSGPANKARQGNRQTSYSGKPVERGSSHTLPHRTQKGDFAPAGKNRGKSGTGHNPTPGQQRNTSETAKNPKGKDGKPLTCFKCGSWNHLQPACPQQPAAAQSATAAPVDKKAKNSKPA
jgi:hypothetical protein